ncbi:MAG: phage tail protein [Caldilineaceae bacterium]
MTEQKSAAVFNISHVPDFYQRYSGETVRFFTRIEVTQPVTNCTVEISAPGFVALHAVEGRNQLLPRLRSDDNQLVLEWAIGALQPATPYILESEALAPNELQLLRYENKSNVKMTWEGGVPWRHLQLSSSARVIGQVEQTQPSEVAAVIIRVSLKSAYLQYLPALYEQDELMGRYLMLFESFGAPLEQRLHHIHHYFEPHYTPGQWLSWLAKWFNSALDETWPEAKRRTLLLKLLHLYRRRGTKQGLKELLEIYTDAEVEIKEHWAQNLQLGPNAQLGKRVALGRDNSPNTFTVRLRLPNPERQPSQVGGLFDQERAAWQEKQLQKLRQMIDTEKPAHADYRIVVL